MKNRCIQRLKRFLGIFTLTMGLCSCSGVNIMNKDYFIKKKTPYTTEVANSQDMRDIRLEYNEYGLTYSTYNTNYFYISNGWTQDNDNDSYFLNCTLDTSYNLNLNVQTIAVENPSIYNVAIMGVAIPLDSTYEDYPNGNLCYICNTNNIANVNVLINHFDTSYSPTQLRTQFQCRSFSGINAPTGATKGITSIYDLSLNTTYNRLYLLIGFGQPITITINENVSQYSTYNLGKLKMFMLDFSNNATYQKQDATNEQLIEQAYNNGYTNGQESGKAIGRQETIDNTYQGKTYQQIYNTGFSDGETTAGGSGALIPSLFGAIVNIPISVLNGLVPLTFFDISIIRVALTFLALGVVMWVIRKVMI